MYGRKDKGAKEVCARSRLPWQRQPRQDRKRGTAAKLVGGEVRKDGGQRWRPREAASFFAKEDEPVSSRCNGVHRPNGFEARGRAIVRWSCTRSRAGHEADCNEKRKTGSAAASCLKESRTEEKEEGARRLRWQGSQVRDQGALPHVTWCSWRTTSQTSDKSLARTGSHKAVRSSDR